MKSLITFFLSLFALLLICNGLVFSEEFTVDLDAGEQVFSQNCVSCHAGGNNLVNPEKTLQFTDLTKNSKNSVGAIVNQVTNGANGMPIFSGRLSEEDIFNVANYVFNQAKSESW
uniref:Cytochrome c-553 n=1 Tax=Polysiphonia sertularioides TaxID=945028 RepID=A0A1Z1M9A0_9FLOR|nr:cytochrome c553 [Polysiphonia sertularioides]ARW62401.1 cytochrome c553 [Polysiphonia sertularioides]